MQKDKGGNKVDMKYSVSLWNYFHYADVPSLERVITLLREQDYGVELWGSWREEKDLFDDLAKGIIDFDSVLAHFDKTLQADIQSQLAEISLSIQDEMITWGKTK